MLVLRRLIASLLLCAALLCGFLACFISDALIDHTLANNRAIDAAFHRAARTIAAFEREHGRLPTPKEFNLSALSETSGYSIFLAEVGDQTCDASPDTFARLRAPDYVIMVWRGEWMECYAPTKGISTLTFDRASYTMLGTTVRDRLAFLGASLACLMLAIWLWRRRLHEHRPVI